MVELVGEPVQHQAGAQDHGGRVGEALAHDVGRGAVAGLEHRVLVADVGRGRHPHAADQPGGEIGQDVAEHVLGHQHVEIPWPAHQGDRDRVDIDVIGANVLVQRRALVKNLAEEREGAKHVRLVDAMHQVLAAARFAARGEPEREVEQPLGGLAGDHQRLARLVMRHHTLPHGPEQALGRLADDHQVDAAFGRADDRARHARDEAGRTHSRIKVEDEAQLDLRRDLGAVRIADVRHPAGAEQDGIGLVAQPHGRLRQRDAGFLVMRRAGGRFGETELQSRGGRLDVAQDIERGPHHLDADAIARNHRDMEAVVGEHADDPVRGVLRAGGP